MTTETRSLAEQVRRHLQRPPGDWLTTGEIAQALSVPRHDVGRALTWLIGVRAVERDVHDQMGVLVVRWRAAR